MPDAVIGNAISPPPRWAPATRGRPEAAACRRTVSLTTFAGSSSFQALGKHGFNPNADIRYGFGVVDAQHQCRKAYRRAAIQPFRNHRTITGIGCCGLCGSGNVALNLSMNRLPPGLSFSCRGRASSPANRQRARNPRSESDLAAKLYIARRTGCR